MDQIEQSFERIFMHCQAALLREKKVPTALNVVVAFSGGCDSMVLLQRLVQWQSLCKGKLVAVHVHHGLSPNADVWAHFCEQTARMLQVDFELCKVRVVSDGFGVEAAARVARYKALKNVAERHACPLILTAHHKDDQLETFLIQWMRGSGIEGLIGMPPLKREGAVYIGRPFLGLSRSEIESYARTMHYSWVNDESNKDTKYLRNAIRHNVIPPMDQARKGWKDAAMRTIDILAEAQKVLSEVTQCDLKAVCDARGKLIVSNLLVLTEARQNLVLREWLSLQNFGGLSRNRLLEIVRQLRETNKKNVRLLVRPPHELRLTEGTLQVAEVVPNKSEDWSFLWTGQKEIRPDNFDGVLLFEESREGFSESFLRAAPLTFTHRKGGETLKLIPKRPTKPLKQLFQEAHIPDFERSRYPLVWQNDALIFVGGLGADVRFKSESDFDVRYALRWLASQ